MLAVQKDEWKLTWLSIAAAHALTPFSPRALSLRSRDLHSHPQQHQIHAASYIVPATRLPGGVAQCLLKQSTSTHLS